MNVRISLINGRKWERSGLFVGVSASVLKRTTKRKLG
jgi:hypothetical protein